MEGTTPLTVRVEKRRPGAAHVLVVAGRAAEKSAVKRNRARRRVRAIMGEWKGTRGGLRVVVVLRRPAFLLTFAALRGELERSLARVSSRH